MCARRKVLSVEDKNLRRSIVESALKEFKAKGIKAVKMDDIAKIMRMSKRTLYEIFTDKESLLIDCMYLMFERRQEYMKKKCSNKDNVVFIVYTYYQLLLKEFSNLHPDFLNEIPKHPRLHKVRDKLRAKNRENALEFYQTGVNEGMFLSDINFEALDEAIYHKFLPLSGLKSNPKFSVNEILLTLVKVVIRGIMTIEGLEEWNRLEKKI